jgi:hypothetical protein
MNTAWRYRWLVLVVVGAGLIVGAVWSERSGSAGRTSTVETAGGKKVRVRGQLGPTPGPDAEGYIAQKRKFLEQAAASDPGRRAAALVSLARFLAPADVSRLAGPARIDLLFVRFPGEDPGLVSVSGAVEDAFRVRADVVAGRLDGEAARLQELARASTGPQRRQYSAQANERRASAASIRAGCSCVYGVLVGATTVGDLFRLQSGSDVRLADVSDPPVADLRGWELRPIIPKT